MLRAWPERRRLAGLYGMAAVAIGCLIGLSWLGRLEPATQEPAFWMMAALAVIADARTIVTPGRHGEPVSIYTSRCFTFAILLCWGFAPAALVQLAATAVFAVRMRHPAWRLATNVALNTFAFAAAAVVLHIGQPDLFTASGVRDALHATAFVVGAILAWLATYSALLLASVYLYIGRSLGRTVGPEFRQRILSTTAILFLSPVLALSTNVNVAFVPLVLVPLYAVERMAKLTTERDRLGQVDPLTGLANRAGVQAWFDERIARQALRSDDLPRLALLLIGLDRFKQVTDALGRDLGDRLLVAVGERLRAAAPVDSTVARLDRDEFAILAPAPDETPRSLATRMHQALSEPVTMDGLHLDLTASIGIAVHPDDSADFTTLMRHADVAVDTAQQRGDRIAAYRPDMDRHSPESLAILTDLRAALSTRDGQLVMHYQPQVDIETGRMVGVEALSRWRHPVHGQMNMEDVLRAVEHTSVMQLLTARVIDDVVAQVDRWNRAGIRLRVSINVSSRDLHGDDIVCRLASRLATYHVSPGQIQMEITEGALMADPSWIAATMERLTGLGVAMSLDDFGTGYSSLQHLRILPLAEVKVDRSFVIGMAHNSEDAAIARSTITLARALGLRVVAEGVENEYTWRQLADAGCHIAQGFYIARPMPAAEISGWLAGREQAPDQASAV